MTIGACASLLALGLTLGACTGRDSLSGPDDGDPSGTGPSPTTAALGCGDNAAPGPVLAFRVRGQGFAAWEGRKVVAAATENGMNARTDPLRRPILVATTIREGAFSVSCPGSLRENYVYPSWALFVDVDGDGRCTSADAGFRQQFYAWNDDIDEEVPGPDALKIISEAPVYALRAPIGSNATSFCAGYFYE